MSPKAILAIRKALKLTQQQLADRIGAQRHTVARWETGRNEPKGAYLKALNALETKAKKRPETAKARILKLTGRF